jgi:hypothetical protein
MNHALAVAFLVVACGQQASVAHAQAPRDDSTRIMPQRPTIVANRRWAEDWSVLADPRVAREPLDELKYMPLSPGHPNDPLALGAWAAMIKSRWRQAPPP